MKKKKETSNEGMSILKQGKKEEDGSKEYREKKEGKKQRMKWWLNE